MRGVLSVLGLDQAALAVARMRERVEALRDAAAPDAAVSEGVFEKLGSSLGALGFLIDTLGYQPALARKLFVYDEARDEFRFVGGRVGAAKPAASAGRYVFIWLTMSSMVVAASLANGPLPSR